MTPIIVYRSHFPIRENIISLPKLIIRQNGNKKWLLYNFFEWREKRYGFWFKIKLKTNTVLTFIFQFFRESISTKAFVLTRILSIYEHELCLLKTIKIFFHKWHLWKIIASIFDNLSDSSLCLVQFSQNRGIRCTYRLEVY